MRRALYLSKRHENGCPKSGHCKTLELIGKTGALCGSDLLCPNLVLPIEPLPDPRFNARLVFLTKLESLVNVGCKFGPNDLDPRTWNELIMFAIERQRMDERVRKARDRKDTKGRTPPEAEAALRTARKEQGVPETGQSLFGPRKSVRR